MRYVSMITLAMVLGGFCNAAEEVKLANPGFELGVIAWDPCGTWGGFSPADREGLYEVVTDKPHSGSKCLKVSDSWNDKSPYIVQQKIPADLTKSYILKVWVRADTPAKGKINIMMMEDVNGQDKFRGTVQESFEATADWQEIVLILEKPLSRTARLVISLIPNGGDKSETSTIYFDDVSLNAVTAEELRKFLTE